MVGNTQKRSAGNNMRLTSASQTAPRVQRKVVRNIALKRTQRGVKEVPAVEPSCDNSNDSGLGLEQHQEYNVALRLLDWPGQDENVEVKRRRLEVKVESDDASFPAVPLRTAEVTPSPSLLERHERMSGPRRRAAHTGVTASQLLGIRPPRGREAASQGTVAASADGNTRLLIVSQPEQQHRARYQTEGSRGAVKDRSGNGFPQVQLSGWLGSATLEVYIGSDCGKVVPHMFYQACRVSGKNSTQCQERTEEGTVIIEVPFEPTKDMVVTCDCVGILKERNVDVEHRFPEQSGSRNKKKSTRCRMVFRTLLTHPDGSQETLQICSQPIACTQPPGIPEICKKSLTSCPVGGGGELFILGKNFLKDTRVVFANPDVQPPWEVSVIPDKEYLQQSHLVCVVPPYHCLDISEPVTVRLTVTSSDKSSEAHCFTYTPQRPVDTAEGANLSMKAVHPEANPPAPASGGTVHLSPTVAPLLGPTMAHKSSAVDTVEPMLPLPAAHFVLVEPKQGVDRESIFPLVMWKSVGSEGTKLMSVSSKAKDLKLLSLPAARRNLQPTEQPPLRRLSASEIKTEAEEPSLFPSELKGIDLRVTAAGHLATPKVSMATGADLSSTLPPSMATLRRFVANDNGSPLPSLSVENFLSRLECNPENAKNGPKAGLASQPERKLVNGNIAVMQPEYIPLDSVLSLSMPAGGPPRVVSDYRRLSEEEIASACLQSSRGVRRKPGKGKSLSPPHYGSRATPRNVQQNGKMKAMSAAGQLPSVVPEQVAFPLQPPASTDLHGRDSLDGRFLSQDLKGLDGTCQQSPPRDGSVHTQVETYGAVGMERNIEVIQPSPEFVALPHYDEDTTGMDSLQSQRKDVSAPLHKTSPFNSYREESMHSPPVESKPSVMPLQEPPFENLSIAHVDSSPPNPMPNCEFIAVSGPAVSLCSLPVASSTSVMMPSQVLPELHNNHRLLDFNCTPLPSVTENTRLIKEQALSPVDKGYVVTDAASPSSCTPPIAVKNILMHSQEPSLYNNYMTESVCVSSVSRSQMSRDNDILLKGHNTSSLNGVTIQCQTLSDENVASVHVTNNTLLETNAPKTHSDFDVKNHVVSACSTPLFASKNITVCSRDIYNFPPENGTANLACSPPSDCVASHSSLQLGSHELSSPAVGTGLVNSMSLPAGNGYDIAHVASTSALGVDSTGPRQEPGAATTSDLMQMMSQPGVAMSEPGTATTSDLMQMMSQPGVAMSEPGAATTSDLMQMMSQPGAETPETVRLDALVRSALDSHIRPPPPPPVLKEGMLPHDLTQMSDHDLISYINPSCFDQV